MSEQHDSHVQLWLLVRAVEENRKAWSAWAQRMRRMQVIDPKDWFTPCLYGVPL